MWSFNDAGLATTPPFSRNNHNSSDQLLQGRLLLTTSGGQDTSMKIHQRTCRMLLAVALTIVLKTYTLGGLTIRRDI